MLLLNLPVKLSRGLTTRATHRQTTIEQVAIEALERGLAFGEETRETDGDTFTDSAAFENALSEFAQMDKN